MPILKIGQQGCTGCHQLEGMVGAQDESIRELRDAGRPMATYFFNVSQREKLHSESQRESMKDTQLAWDKASRAAHKLLVDVENGLQATTCANCGRAWEFREALIAGDDGEWFCSAFCLDCHEALGCPRERVDHIDEMQRRYQWRRENNRDAFALTPETEASHGC